MFYQLFSLNLKTLIALAGCSILTVILCCPATSQAQALADTKSVATDTMAFKGWYHHTNPRSFGRAAIEMGMAEVIPWTFDRYLKRANYAYISFSTIADNLKPSSWTWDNDPFQTNQFGHPYHGSYFFNAFRSNGYSFWQSVPAAFVGSYVWETYAENQKPAPNDFINTSFGGVILGEMTYRLSNKIINNRSTGVKRQVSEVIALLINPMNGLTRLTTGKWGRVTGNSIEHDSSKISMEFDLGVRRFRASANFLNHGKVGWYAHIKMLYGTPYEHYRTPFSNIYINTEFGQDDSSKVNLVSVYGSLAGWKIYSAQKLNLLAVMSANYDFIHNEAFFYGAQSLKMNLFSNFQLSNRVKINLLTAAGPVLLAAVPDGYFYHGRNYDYTSGVGVTAHGGLTLLNKFFYTVDYHGGWLRTINGKASHYFLHTLSNEVSYRFANKLSVCLEPAYFILEAHYSNIATVNRKYPYIRASLRYSIDP